MVKAITPEEVEAQVKKEKEDSSRFPDFVIEAFNECIKNAAFDGSKKFTQKEVVALIIKKSNKKTTSNKIFDNNWLDVEPVYQKLGWNLQYYKYAYNETGEDYFYF